jgi:hypothetical protein
MSEPTPPRGSDPQQPASGREETRPFTAPVPPQQPVAAGPVTVAEPASPDPARRRTLRMGAAAAGLLGVGVVVGVIVGQATADPAAASSTTQTAPDGTGQQYGTPPDGGMGGMPPGGMGGRGGFGAGVPDGTDDGTTDDGTDDSATDDGATDDTTATGTVPDGTTLDS